jgi:hypothetical protein
MASPPHGSVPEPVIRAQLERILASESFSGSPLLSSLLRFIVEKALEEKQDTRLKEIAIADAVYGPDPDFHPADSTKVRTLTRALRTKLVAYYSSPLEHEVRISVARGYKPVFTWFPDSKAQASHQLTGTWQARVAYRWRNWGGLLEDEATETFTFELDGECARGTATFRGAKYGFLDGKVDGNRIAFNTRGVRYFNTGAREETLAYHGRIAGDEIKFDLLIHGGSGQYEPCEFTAVRIA